MLSGSPNAPAPRELWQELVRSDPLALPYQSPEWLDSICSSGRYINASRAYQFTDGMTAVLPLVRLRGPRRVVTASSLPEAWGIGGLVCSAPPSPSHIKEVLTDLAQQPYLHIRVRPNPMRAQVWSSANTAHMISAPRRVHVLDLEGGIDAVWTLRYKKSTRSGIRFAERAGLEIQCGNDARLLREFYSVLEASIERWADGHNEPLRLARLRFRQRDPISKFHAISRSMGSMCRIWIARHEGRPIAASLRLVNEAGNANAARSAMIKAAAAPLRANDLLQHLAIEDACRSGCRYFVLGESGESRGIAEYKERFGAVPVDYPVLHVDRWRAKRAELAMRSVVKRAIRFRDVAS